MTYEERLKWLKESHEQLLTKKNHPIEGNGVYERYANPVLTADHAPLEWRYDLHKETNPYLMERFGIHAAFNSGAIKFGGKYVLVARVEGADRKSFFAVAESEDGTEERPIHCTYSYGKPVAGEGHFIHTYKHDGNPLPSFEGEPELVKIAGDIDDFSLLIWDSLNRENRVSLFVRFIDIETGATESRIINANK